MPKTNALTVRHAHIVPSILANAGENAATKFLEFFAAYATGNEFVIAVPFEGNEMPKHRPF
jgi:hypothetical protein